MNQYYLALQTSLKSLKQFPKELYVLFILKLCESYNYFAISQILVIFLSRSFNFSDLQSAGIYGLWGTCITFWGLLTATLNDILGVKRALLIGFILSAISTLALTFVISPVLLQVILFIFLPLGNSMGMPMLTVGVRRYTNSKNRGFAFGLYYSVMNMGAFVSGISVDFFNINSNSATDSTTNSINTSSSANTNSSGSGTFEWTGNRMVILTTTISSFISFLITLLVLKEFTVTEAFSNDDGYDPITGHSPYNTTTSDVAYTTDKGQDEGMISSPIHNQLLRSLRTPLSSKTRGSSIFDVSPDQQGQNYDDLEHDTHSVHWSFDSDDENHGRKEIMPHTEAEDIYTLSARERQFLDAVSDEHMLYKDTARTSSLSTLPSSTDTTLAYPHTTSIHAHPPSHTHTHSIDTYIHHSNNTHTAPSSSSSSASPSPSAAVVIAPVGLSPSSAVYEEEEEVEEVDDHKAIHITSTHYTTTIPHTTTKLTQYDIIKQLCASKTFWRYAIFTLFLINLNAVFRHLDATFPTYLIRTFGDDVPKGLLYSINPFMIIILTPLVSAMTTMYAHYDMIKYGGYVSALSPMFLAVSESIWACVCFMVVLSLGEAVWSPRTYDYTMSIAPEV